MGACQLHKNLSFLLLVAHIGSGLRSWDDNKNPVVANGLSQRSRSLSLTKRIATSGNEIGLLAAPQKSFLKARYSILVVSVISF